MTMYRKIQDYKESGLLPRGPTSVADAFFAHMQKTEVRFLSNFDECVFLRAKVSTLRGENESLNQQQSTLREENRSLNQQLKNIGAKEKKLEKDLGRLQTAFQGNLYLQTRRN